MQNIFLKEITSKRVIKAVLIVVGMGIGFAVFGGVLLLSLYLGDKYIYHAFYTEIFQKPIWYLFLCLVFVITSLLGIWLVFKVKKLKTNHKSFTLIELLVVIAIIGVLAAIVITSMSGAITRSKIVRLQAFSDSIRAQLSDSLVSWWPFNEGTGTDAKDMWEGNNGTLGGGTPDYYPAWKSGGECVSGKCLEFDGENDYVDCGNSVTLTPDGYHTFEAWIKAKSYNDKLPFILSMGPTRTLFAISLADDTLIGEIQVRRRNSNGTGYGAESNATFNFNNWHHVVLVYNGSQNYYLIYIDSQEVSQSKSIAWSSYNGSKTTLGRDEAYPTSGYNWGGLIDEVHIYNSAASITQIQSQYLAGLDKLLSNGAISKSEYNQRTKELSNSLVNE